MPPLRQIISRLRPAARRILTRLRPSPPPLITADTTVDTAWRSHPHAPQVFARHHLPHCDGCAVRFDERLGELADGYELDLDRLLDELRALNTG